MDYGVVPPAMQASKGITSHELVHGKTYNSAFGPFSSVCICETTIR